MFELTKLLGGYPKFISEGFNDAYLPVWLQEAGYNTYYTGKLFVRAPLLCQTTSSIDKVPDTDGPRRTHSQ